MIDVPSGAIGNIATPQTGLLLGVAAAVAVVVGMAFLVLQRNRRQDVVARERFAYSQLDGARRSEMRRIYRQALEGLQRQGRPLRLAHQTPHEYAESVSLTDGGDGESKEAFRQLSDWVTRAAYDPAPLPEDLLRRARELLGRLSS
jgi:hypothetical protein